jgi:alpha-1,6-mannosyltransferase
VARHKGLIVSLLLAATLLLYVYSGILAISPYPVVGKMSPAGISLYRNVFFRTLINLFGLSSRNFAKMFTLAMITIWLIVIAYFIILYMTYKYNINIDIKVLLLLAGACVAVMVLVPPVLSRDIYSMIFYGKMESYYGLNPYLTSPQHLVGDPLLALISTNWKNTGMVYGPLSGMLGSFSYFLWGNNLTANVIFLKAVMGACHLFNAYMVWRICGRIEGINRNFAAMVYALNPLVILQSAGGGHFDVAMMSLALLALDRYMLKRYFDCFALLLLSCCVKYVTVIPTLLTAVIIIRRRPLPSQKIKTGLAYAGTALFVFAAMYYPYFSRLAIFKPLFTNLRLTNVASAGFYVRKAMGGVLRLFMLSPGTSSALAGVACSVLFICLFLTVLYHLLLDFDRDEDLGKTWFWAFFALLLFSSYVLPWYFIWIIALIPFRRWDRYSTAVLLLSTLGFFFACDIWL